MEEFKNAFFYQLEQGRIASPTSEDEHQNQWLINFKNLDVFKNYLCKDFEELIFHGPKHLQTIAKDRRTNESIKEIPNWQMQLIYLALLQDQSWNTNSPQISFRFYLFEQTFRFTLVHGNCFSDNTSRLFVRKIKTQGLDLGHFIKSDQGRALIEKLVVDKENILVCGATGSGKTSLLNAMLEYSHPYEHLISIEDTQEIFLRGNSHSQLLASKHSMQDFCHYALRMNPDRLIVGEIRSNEVVPLVLCMNTGHKGVMTTLHANSATDSIDRLATLFQLYHPHPLPLQFLYKLLCNGIGYAIYVENKQVHSIIKVLGNTNDRLIYEYMYSSDLDLLKTGSF